MTQIYVHGLGQTPDSWNKVLMQMKPAECSMCPNLAELVQGNEVTYHHLYAAFSDVCNMIDEPLRLCGLSLGGVLALNYAIEHPQKVRSLVLIATQYKMPKGLLRVQNILFRFMPKSMFQEMGFGKSEFLQLCKAMMELNFRDSLQKVTCPALVICGEKDTANKSASVELATFLPHAELRVLNGTGHEANTEAPEKLAEVLREFYNRVS